MGIIGDGVEIMRLVNMGANADVHEKLGKFIDRANDLQAKVEQLEEANKEMTERLRIEGSLFHVDGVLFIQGDPYPLCSKCCEVSKLLVHVPIPRSVQPRTPLCAHCGTYYAHANLRQNMHGPEIKFVL